MRHRFPLLETRHFATRAAQRGLSSEVLAFVVEFGREFPSGGATSLTVLDRDLPAALRRSPMAGEARDWVVVQKHGHLFTCYRRKGASRFLRRKATLPRWARPCQLRNLDPIREEPS